jgi:hypothetical protein
MASNNCQFRHFWYRVKVQCGTQCSMRWTTRVVLILAAGMVGYTAFATIKQACIDFVSIE